MNSSVWIEVSVNIGQRCLRIEIQRNERIEDVVNRFIEGNKLSVRYQTIISNMIREEVSKRVAKEEGEKREEKGMGVGKLEMSCGGEGERGRQSLGGKENQMMAEVMRIQAESNRKKVERLSELRETSQSKKSVMAERSDEEGNRRTSFKKFEVVKQSTSFLSQTPKRVQDISPQSSKRTFHSRAESSSKDPESSSNSKSNIFSRKQSKIHIESKPQIPIRNQITSDVAELKLLLSHHSAYNSQHKEQESLWGEPSNQKSVAKIRLKTETPQNIYEKWRRLDQQKKLESQSKQLKLQSKSQSKSPLIKRQDTFFYNKGKTFLQEKQRKVESKFKEIYPFKISKSGSSKVGVETSNRLFKESKEYFSKKMVKPKHVNLDLGLKMDPIREKVRQRDREQDQIISELISEGRLKSPVAIGYKEKSPFRKTICFH